MKAIAIDGPAGAGKSTIAKELAKRIGYIYIDTGALYRAIGLYVLKNNFDITSEIEIKKILNDIEIEILFLNDTQHVFLNGNDVTDKIRTSEISMAASTVSAMPCVREFLFDLQKNLAKKNNVVMDGRDIGTVVLPFADLKIFLTASVEERAKRRFDELILKSENVKFEDVFNDVKTRDYNDSTRETAPLKQAEDAILVDTTGYSLEKSINMIYNIIKEKLNI